MSAAKLSPRATGAVVVTMRVAWLVLSLVCYFLAWRVLVPGPLNGGAMGACAAVSLLVLVAYCAWAGAFFARMGIVLLGAAFISLGFAGVRYFVGTLISDWRAVASSASLLPALFLVVAVLCIWLARYITPAPRDDLR